MPVNPAGLFSFPFGIQRAPGGSSNPIEAILYSAGLSEMLPRQQSIYQDTFMRNLRQGRPGYAGFPEWFTSQPGGGTGTGGGSGNGSGGSGSPDLSGLPAWWREWYNTSGKYGGVPPVQGLL